MLVSNGGGDCSPAVSGCPGYQPPRATLVGTVLVPSSYPHLPQIQQMYNQVLRGGISQGWLNNSLADQYHALFLACETSPSVCGSALVNALMRGGLYGTAMNGQDFRAIQDSGLSPMHWLQSNGGQVVLGNSMAVSAAVGLFRPGRLGGLAHQNMVNDIAEAYSKAGYIVDQEVHIPTPGGFKPYRFADVGIFDPETGAPLMYIQVGRFTAGGFPVMRETLAAGDIWSATGVPVSIEPYNGEQ
jgi:hypothetical protein